MAASPYKWHSSTMPSSFEWDPRKDLANQEKHGIGITEAQNAFLDRRRILAQDLNRSTSKEARYYCYGSYGGGILTVRFTYRGGIIRMFGAGYWSKGKRIYEQENQVHEGPRRSCKDR